VARLRRIAVLGEGSVYTLEAKTLSRRCSVFKYRIAFSVQAFAETLGQEAHPLVAFVEKRGGPLTAVAALLAPAAVPDTPYPVEEMRPLVGLAVEIGWRVGRTQGRGHWGWAPPVWTPPSSLPGVPPRCRGRVSRPPGVAPLRGPGA